MNEIYLAVVSTAVIESLQSVLNQYVLSLRNVLIFSQPTYVVTGQCNFIRFSMFLLKLL